VSSRLVAMLLSAGAFGPFGSVGHPVTRDAVAAPARSRPADRSNTYEVAYLFYSGLISPTDGPRCIHRPTCSRYGLLAVRRHGVLGLLLTIDRLMRDDTSSALRRLPVIEDEGGTHFLDPLEESTFWFSNSH
jgi:hypothetical protein